MRKVLAALGVVMLLAVSGCDKPDDAVISLPPVAAPEAPAASAGGACILWDWTFIEKKIGVRFSVAASDQVDDTSTCVVQTVSGSWPDLSLSVVEQTKADAKIFLASRMPEKSVKLKGLGKAGYRLNTAATGGHGPSVEIGWLSEAEQLQTLKFTFAKGASNSAVTQMNTKLLDLAKAMDTTDG
ncbi:hypothetical protein [Actinoplanes regularis]|uniref:Uncharacterized protein n=1 Tax=Actinoplanes regularis TaxID=52697 RepID=A0A238UY72_9ACTN|nr:hypothetical protein [Actinoplanes regularis]GIE84248.1 hypothetical protein Are01nite_07280 [Actinoplanes regularis]SNR26918.1 hypothetical protein SAMN06264365_101338 [Actinoplanes regularis]